MVLPVCDDDEGLLLVLRLATNNASLPFSFLFSNIDISFSISLYDLFFNNELYTLSLKDSICCVYLYIRSFISLK